MVTFNNDLDVLNYALTLEHFETALYKALIGTNILTGVEAQYLTTFGQQEAAHVSALTDTIKKLGGTPVSAMPSYNLAAAGPITNRDQLVNVILTVEDVGASAYLGAAGFLQNKDLLEVAVNIHNVEAEHAAVWRFQQNMPAAPDTVAKGRTPDEVIAIVTPFLSAATTAPAPASGSAPAPSTGTGSSGPVGSGSGSSTPGGASTTPTTSTAGPSGGQPSNFVRRLGDG